MAFDDIRMQIAGLWTEMINQPEDAPELYEVLHEKLNELKATGMPLPADLVELERKLEAEIYRRR